MPVISSDGQRVAFRSAATNLDSITPDTNAFQDICVRDRVQAKTVRVSINADGSEADNDCLAPDISGDGLMVAFHSRALTLVTPNDTDIYGDDVFAHDLTPGLTSGVTYKLTVNASTGGEANGQPYNPSLSYDGWYVVYQSGATDLGPADAYPGSADIYGYDWWMANLLSVSTAGTQANDHSTEPKVSGNARYIAFLSQAYNLTPESDGSLRLYLRDRALNTTIAVGPGYFTAYAFPRQAGPWAHTPASGRKSHSPGAGPERSVPGGVPGRQGDGQGDREMGRWGDREIGCGPSPRRIPRGRKCYGPPAARCRRIGDPE
ncbi:MAG: hypothetical protein HYY17_08320 [Planctomycetes bacterium]|nr:hypothetical protein [Planctomycetota bacterium]